MTGTIRPESLERRLEQFFRDNPHEELSTDDMMIKFGCSKKSAEAALSRLRSIGMPILRVAVYRLKSTEEGA